jgi:hypothetical protein
MFVFCLYVGRPRQATDVLQPAGLLYCPLWTFQLWPPDAPVPTDAFRTLAAEVGTYGRRIRTGKFCLNADFHGTLRDRLHAANLRHGTYGFTSLPKESVLRMFPPLKIRRLRPGLICYVTFWISGIFHVRYMPRQSHPHLCQGWPTSTHKRDALLCKYIERGREVGVTSLVVPYLKTASYPQKVRLND